MEVHDGAAAPPKSTLLLFDIDGTLLSSGGAGEHSLRLALQDWFGNADALSGVEIAGRTDGAIVRQLFALHGVEPTPEKITGFFDCYLQHLSRQLPAVSGRLLPGIVELLEILKTRTDVAIALLTGNLCRGAELKLAHYGIWHYFEFGAYADDHHDRNQLAQVAARRALEKHGVSFAPERTFVLGDTPHDVACGRAIGAKTVAIATGGYTREQLQACGPDFLFDDLSDSAAVLQALGL